MSWLNRSYVTLGGLVLLCLGLGGYLLATGPKTDGVHPAVSAASTISDTSTTGSTANTANTGSTGSTANTANTANTSSAGSKAPEPSSASPSAFAPAYVEAPAPAAFQAYPRSLNVQAAASICAVTESGCAGLVSGATPTCTFPAYPESMAGVTGVGWAMWRTSAGGCVYAMGTTRA